MEILRDNTYAGTYPVVLEPNTPYVVTVLDLYDNSEDVQNLTSNGDGEISVELPSRYYTYDGEVMITVSYDDSPVWLDTIYIIRPYCSIDKMVTELGGKYDRNQVIEFEMVARYIIDNYTGPFDYRRKTLRERGTGTDYLVTRDFVSKVYGIKEAGETLEDTALALNGYVMANSDNKLEYTVAWNTRYRTPMFWANVDYEIDADCGWRVVPNDIRLACEMLVADLACGNNRYANKYIKNVNGVTYFDKAMDGTGNMIVDKIISKHVVDSIGGRVL
jgi:hypothetical protein